MTNLVNSLQFEVICPDEELSLNLRQNFAQTFQADIAEVIEEVCSRYVGENESIKIDRLELDLGAFSKHTFGTDFKKTLAYKFEQELTKSLSKITPLERQVSRQLSDAGILVYFLLNGTLPWWADETTVNINHIWQEVSIVHENWFRNFIYQNRDKETLWRRILWQLNVKSKGIVVNLSPELKSVRELFAFWIVKLSDKITALKKTNPSYSFAPADGPAISYNEQAINDVLIKNAVRIFSDITDTAALGQIFETYVADIFKGNTAITDAVNLVFNDVLTENNTVLLTAASPKLAAPGAAEDEMPFAPVIDELDEKHLVKYAGIVLITPFLKTFFTELDLLDGGKWKDNESAFKAVHLLKFLSNGNTLVPEYSLIFEKLLCGLPLEAPVPLNIVLNDREIEEASTLLKSVIEHWKALKNTSVDGLREAFFKRDGLITKNDSGWLLQVERKTLDVLLDNIPWGYSTVNLPWNNYILFVEW